ncbi:protein GET4 KNAG_0M01060 [Huiozyma naganishii CBS 8797]|uniref:Golgi to ER traffic protein 4 n=1 Tax=Huiozyma naganishii (strain ATCC MYA-139 / BCRC 22969 / CBS 8797 / KCTC 17520 / NBRC 10181 / NCYC 3082 / Yp74L-3) TaxID=1071383 RepID=J7SAR5_HUIN7|nr:hypothetical protein KNAG_0M01060 [Kazachstania naganishii CBS 8797]CCK72959.1 hypothetical protein KNAG_0M01060 [Kazachstania naganishii CBS 8797]
MSSVQSSSGGPCTPQGKRSLERFSQRVSKGEFYEAHQALRAVINRYVNRAEYAEAVELAAGGAELLLKAGQGGSGADLVFYLLEVYDVAGVAVDDASVARLVQLLVLLDATDPTLKDVATGMNNWSVKHGECPFGDPRLHNAVAAKLLEAGLVYESERYMLLGTEESLEKYVDLLYGWFEDAGSDALAGDFVSRLVFNYLFIGNVKFALRSSQQFLTRYVDSGAAGTVDTITKDIGGDSGESTFTMLYFADHMELNFLQLVLLTCMTKNRDLFATLKQQYADCAKEYSTQLQVLGQEYFGITAPKQANFLQDMMSGFLGG